MLIVLCNLTICCTSKSIGHCPAWCPSPCLSHYLLYLQIQVRSSVVHACFLFPCPFPMSVLVPLFQAYYSCPCSLSLSFCLCPYPSVPVSQFLSLTHCPSPSSLSLFLSLTLCPCLSVSVPVPSPRLLCLCFCPYPTAFVTLALFLFVCNSHCPSFPVHPSLSLSQSLFLLSFFFCPCCSPPVPSRL